MVTRIYTIECGARKLFSQGCWDRFLNQKQNLEKVTLKLLYNFKLPEWKWVQKYLWAWSTLYIHPPPVHLIRCNLLALLYHRLESQVFILAITVTHSSIYCMASPVTDFLFLWQVKALRNVVSTHIISLLFWRMCGFIPHTLHNFLLWNFPIRIKKLKFVPF